MGVSISIISCPREHEHIVLVCHINNGQSVCVVAKADLQH